ncbi:hypothetical protein LA03_05990 [Burkholderia gladioli]|uniref:hypothetical protein n=1 Tax=Burkholderia gladioli TaxID=28095 RepID=UPI00050DE624|nr:hypothetical protein [Burkholderia gladioli]KGE11118.1 hypothetical protein LA03_05990 [Burkholderia gladioli]
MSSVISFPTIAGQSVNYEAGGIAFVISLPAPDALQDSGERVPSALYELRLPNGEVVYSTADGILGLIQAIVDRQVAANQADADKFLRDKNARWSLQSKRVPGNPPKNSRVWVLG